MSRTTNIIALLNDLVQRITPPQFDSSNKFPTTEFVQRALGNMRGFEGISTRAITAADAGKVFQPADGVTVTFPTPSSIGVPIGASITIWTGSRVATTLQAGAGAALITDTSRSSIVLSAGQSVTLAASDASSWIVSNYDQHADIFKALVATNGYQKLPSGVIVQWGRQSFGANSTTTVSLPVAFPNAFVGGLTCVQDNVATVTAYPFGALLPVGLSQFSHRAYYNASNITHFWLAIGY